MNFELGHAWVMVLLPLAMLPVIRPLLYSHAVATLLYIPNDRPSNILSLSLRLLGILTISALIIALSDPYRPAYNVERIGQGAHVVLLLDRSRSMDQPFVPQKSTLSWVAVQRYPSKGEVARMLLSRFVDSRENDLFGMVIFSSYPIEVLPLTQKQDVIQAAIEAGNIGRGLAETDIGQGLEQALQLFEGQEYTGSRIIMLVSDGAANLDINTRERISYLLEHHRVALYWIYLRSRNSPDIDNADEITPQRILHQFFSTISTPYTAYKAEDPKAVQTAITDVGRLQNLPMRYQEVIPRFDLAHIFYSFSLLFMLILLIAYLMETRPLR